MSGFDDLVSGMDAELCAAFGDPAELFDADGQSYPDVSVVISEGVEIFSPDGDVIGTETHVELQKTDIGFSQGWYLLVSGKKYRVGERITDDGLWLRYRAVPVSVNDSEIVEFNRVVLG